MNKTKTTTRTTSNRNNNKNFRLEVDFFYTKNILFLIHRNLLYPYGLNNSRQFVRVSVHINKAQILVKSENNIFEQFRSSIFNVNQWLNSNDQAEDENESELEIIIDKNLNPNDVQSRKIRSILNPFVKVSYAGLTVSFFLLTR